MRHTHLCASQSSAATKQQATRKLLALACGFVLVASGQVQAQAVYRIVGPDGRVTFSDKPPATSAAQAKPLNNSTAANSSGGAALPFELRQVVAKYPVTLYTSSNCAPCDSGRSLLITRGVPFAEKTISTAQDAEALQSLSSAASLPFLTIGVQHVPGFSNSEWTQYLNAAGYPERSKLPASYRIPVATPLTSAPTPVSVEAPQAAQSKSAPVMPTPPRVNPNNPAGIQF